MASKDTCHSAVNEPESIVGATAQPAPRDSGTDADGERLALARAQGPQVALGRQAKRVHIVLGLADLGPEPQRADLHRDPFERSARPPRPRAAARARRDGWYSSSNLPNPIALPSGAATKQSAQLRQCSVP